LHVAGYDSNRSPRHFYRWIDDHELLFFREKSPIGRTATSWDFYKRDILTGQETSLTALSRLTQNSFTSSSQFAISPDGKRFFWTGKGITVTTPNGKQPFHLLPEANDVIFQIDWAEDSNHLVVYSSKSDDPQSIQRTLYDIQARKATQRFTVEYPFVADATAIGNRLYTIFQKAQRGTKVTETIEIDEKEEGNTPQSSHQYSVPIPRNLHFGSAKLSPRGDRIAWQFIDQGDTLPTLLVWLHRLIPAFHPPPSKPKVSLWVSRLNGSQLHELGYVLVPTLPPGSAVPWSMLFDHLSWLPDGKHLSFQHDDALYTVPAD